MQPFDNVVIFIWCILLFGMVYRPFLPANKLPKNTYGWVSLLASLQLY